MLSEYDARKLEGLERELRKEAPALVRRIETFGRGRLWFRAAAAATGVLVGLGFIVAGISLSTGLFGTALVAVCSWEFRRRLIQLRDDSPARQRPRNRR